MRRISSATCILALLSATPATVRATNTARASISSGGEAPGKLDPTGKTNLYAYSVQTKTPAGPNASVFTTLTSNGVPVMPAPAATTFANNSIPVPVPRQGTILYGPPTVGLLNQPKELMKIGDDFEAISSTSGAFLGVAAQQVLTGGATRRVAAQAQMTSVAQPPPVGRAAAMAYDPIIVPGGSSNTYAPHIDTSIQFDSPLVSGGVGYYAVDSTTFTSDTLENFNAAGTPLDQTLWMLGLNADHTIAIAADVGVEFLLNPISLNEMIFPNAYLLSLPGYFQGMSNPALALLIDARMDADIGAALSVDASGAATLSDYSLFPAGTLYSPSSDVQYGDASEAVIQSADVPEPATLTLFGLAALAISRRPSRRCA